MSHGTSSRSGLQPSSASYPEIEYVRWCRARAVSRGERPDSGLFVHIYRRDRPIFEAELRSRDRLTRTTSDLTEIGSLLWAVAG